MKNCRIQIGTDADGREAFLVSGRIRHSLISGGSLTEREMILRSIAESVSSEGIPCLITDAHGGMSGLAAAAPCTFWDLKGKTGLPLRTTVTELGPTLMSVLLNLNEKQEELLRIVFKIADDSGLLLIDTRDLKALINELTENVKEYQKGYGRLSAQSLSALIGAVVSLEIRGAEDYIFEPAIDVMDFIGTDAAAAGRVHIIDAAQQEEEPRLYACFLMFILGELYENLDDVSDGEEIRLVIIIEDAGILFDALGEPLIRKAAQILEGLRGRGVAVCLAGRSPGELPQKVTSCIGQTMDILAGNAVEFKFTDGDEALSPQGRINTAMQESGAKPLDAKSRELICSEDPLHEKYKIPFDRDSAYEFLKRRGIDADAAGLPAAEDSASEEKTEKEKSDMAKRARSSAKSLSSTVAGTVGRKVGRSIGSSFGSFGESLGANVGASLGRGIVNTLFKS